MIRNAARLLATFLAGASLVLAAGLGPQAKLNLKSIDGQRVRLSDTRGKIVVLNFWATWCAPCTAEMPMLVEAAKDYQPKGVVFIAASVDEGKSKKNVPDFVSKYHVGFAVWLDASMDDLSSARDGTCRSRYGIPRPGRPHRLTGARADARTRVERAS